MDYPEFIQRLSHAVKLPPDVHWVELRIAYDEPAKLRIERYTRGENGVNREETMYLMKEDQ